MMRFSSHVLALSICALASSPVAAQTFSGAHVDALAGWSNSERGTARPDSRDDGFVYAIGGGYDLRTGNVVVGVVGEVSDVTGRSCGMIDRPAGAINLPSVNGRACGKQGRTLFGGLRAGYVVEDKTLLYVTGGYANAREAGSFDGTIDGAAAKFSTHGNRDGIRVGAGVERALGQHVSLKAEYRYTAVGHELSSDQHQVVAGVGFHF